MILIRYFDIVLLIAAHRTIVATSRLPATAPRIVGGRPSRGARGLLMAVGDGFGHAGAR